MKSALPFTLKGLQTLSFFIYFDENVIQFLDIKNKEVTCKSYLFIFYVIIDTDYQLVLYNIIGVPIRLWTSRLIF